MEKKILTYPIKIALSIFVLGILFFTMLWPGGNDLIILGGGFTSILYVIRFIKKRKYTFLNIFKLLTVLAVSYLYMAPIVHWPSLGNVSIIALVIVTFWIFYEGPKKISLLKNKLVKDLNIGIVLLSIFAILIGSMFKIMHWPFSDIITILGYLILILWLLLGGLLNKLSKEKHAMHSDIIDDEFLNN